MPAFTNTAQADIQECLEIENSLDRLSCYDKEAGYDPGVTETTVGSGNWTVTSETSKMDDSTNVFLSLTSDEQTNCPYKSGPHSLHMACRENQTNLWIYFGDCFMSSIQGRGKVTYRLDSDSATSKNFRESNDNMALGLWSGGRAIPFIKQMLGHEKMIVRATPFSDRTVTADYTIDGLEEAVKPLREACNW
jgi:type VI secretion system protein VasI